LLLDPVSLCDSDWTHDSGNCYFPSEYRTTHPASRTLCENAGGHLVSIRDETEQNFVASLL